MESPRDDNLNRDNDYVYTVTTCRCLVVQTLCKPSPFSSCVVGNEVVNGHSARTLRAYCAASTYDSAECIATPPEYNLDDEQIRAPLASSLYQQEREASAERSQVYHSERENLMSSSSQDPISTGKPVALFSSPKLVESRRIFR